MNEDENERSPPRSVESLLSSGKEKEIVDVPRV